MKKKPTGHGTTVRYAHGMSADVISQHKEWLAEAVHRIEVHDALVRALMNVLAMHAMPNDIYRDNIGAMASARAAFLKAHKEQA